MSLPRVDILTASASAFALGVVGDLGLNILTRQDWFFEVGLRKYFRHHGILEAVFIAAGLMFASMWSAIALWNGSTHHKWFVPYLFVFGAFLDVAFRVLRLMPSLDCMYNVLHPVTSIVWAGGPLVVALWCARYFVSMY